MERKKNNIISSLLNSSLYVLTPPDIIDTDLLIPMVIKAIRAGADIIQLRNKMPGVTARELIKVGLILSKAVHKEGAIFIVNDRIDIAMAVAADGVHLGQEDLPINLARPIIPPGRNLIIGVSTHSIEQAIQAESGGADYIGFGPIFPTSAKSSHPGIGTGFFPLLNKTIGIPYFAIGGINSENITQILGAGASRIAICSGIFGEKDISCKTKLIKSQLLLKNKKQQSLKSKGSKKSCSAAH